MKCDVGKVIKVRSAEFGLPIGSGTEWHAEKCGQVAYDCSPVTNIAKEKAYCNRHCSLKSSNPNPHCSYDDVDVVNTTRCKCNLECKAMDITDGLSKVCNDKTTCGFPGGDIQYDRQCSDDKICLKSLTNNTDPCRLQTKQLRLRYECVEPAKVVMTAMTAEEKEKCGNFYKNQDFDFYTQKKGETVSVFLNNTSCAVPEGTLGCTITDLKVKVETDKECTVKLTNIAAGMFSSGTFRDRRLKLSTNECGIRKGENVVYAGSMKCETKPL